MELINVLGEPLRPCGCQSMTGWYQDGFCRTDDSDLGQHAICSVMTEGFLNYTFAQGNNLIDPNPIFQFDGLKPGDHWCLCVSRWEEARTDCMAPPVVLESTHVSTLKTISLDILQGHEYSRG